MGLDQYLEAEIFVKRAIDSVQVKKTNQDWLDAPARVVAANGEKISSVTLEVGYWRKANAIHKWFVDNVQAGVDDCGRYLVKRKDLEDLQTAVMRCIANPALGKQLLPTTQGFFFGGTEYDEYYEETLKETLQIAEDALEILDEADDMTTEFYYQSSW